MRAGDRAAVEDICLRTADAGDDATDRYHHPELPAAVWATPYVLHEPESGLVLVDDRDHPVGYVLAALDSHGFATTLEEHWWPGRRDRYPLGTPARSDAERHAIHLVHHPPAVPAVAGSYPSHLHIDLLPEAQGAGHGRRLLDELFTLLARRGSTGVHLGVAARNERAIGFYRAVGFTELAADERGVVFGRRLP